MRSNNGGKIQELSGRDASEIRKYIALVAGETQKREALNRDKKQKDKAKRRAKRKRTGR